MTYWTVAESCDLMEEVAADLLNEAGDRREGLSRQRELEAAKLRSVFKLIPGGLNPKLGFEEVRWRAAEFFSDYDPEEVRNLLRLDDSFDKQ